MIGGYTERSGASREIGSLLLGVHDERGGSSTLGNVGTGWDARSASELHTKLRRLRTDTAPFAGGASDRSRSLDTSRRRRDALGGAAAPCRDRTSPSGPGRPCPRMPRSTGLRSRQERASDMTARARRIASIRKVRIRRPRSRHRAAAATAVAAASQRNVSNPDRVIDPSTGLKKLDLVRYYQSVARSDPAASARPAGLLVRGPGRHRRRAVLPEARRQAWHSRHPRARSSALAGSPGAARDRERTGVGRRRADERDRVAHLELAARHIERRIGSSSISIRAKA